MATISTLAVNLIARTSAFERGMKRGRKATKSLKSTIVGTIGSVTRFAKGLVLAAGVGGMGFLLKNTLSTLDAVSKLSRRLGIAHEALLGLRHAGELAGISVQAMDKALETFTRRMGEVKAGSGEAKRGLESLGLSAQKMIAMTPDKALLVIADRIETLGTQAEKAAAAYFLFGRTGAQMLNLFEQGSEGIIKAQKAAKELGITLEGYDLTQVEAANDAILSLKKSITSLFQVATIKLAPALTKIVEIIIKYRKEIASTVKNTVVFIAKTALIVKTITLVGGAIRGLISIYKSLAAAQTITLALGGPAGWATIAAGVGIATVAIIGMNNAIDSAIAGLDQLSGKKVGVENETTILDDIAQRKRIISKLELKNANKLATIRKKILDQQLIQESESRSTERGSVSRIVDSFREVKRLHKEREALSDNTISKAIASQSRQIILAKERLKILREEKAIADAAAKAEILKLTNMERLKKLEVESNRIKDSLITPLERIASQELLIAELFEEGLLTLVEYGKAMNKLGSERESFFKTDTAAHLGDLPSGRFQEIRSEFIDVAALNARDNTKGVDRTNELLEDIFESNRRIIDSWNGTSTT